MDKREDSNNLLGTRYWMLDTGYWVPHILNGHEVIGFVAIGFFDDVFPAGEVVQGGLWVVVNVFIPGRGVGWGDCFYLDTHFELGHRFTQIYTDYFLFSHRRDTPVQYASLSLS